MLERIMKRWRTWAEATHLDRLDDRLLADIGLHRDQVRSRSFGLKQLVCSDADGRSTSGTCVRGNRHVMKCQGMSPVRTASTTPGASG